MWVCVWSCGVWCVVFGVKGRSVGRREVLFSERHEKKTSNEKKREEEAKRPSLSPLRVQQPNTPRTSILQRTFINLDFLSACPVNNDEHHNNQQRSWSLDFTGKIPVNLKLSH